MQEMTGGHASRPGNPKGHFPFSLLHTGGDEVDDLKCWQQNKRIMKWLQARSAQQPLKFGYMMMVGKAAGTCVHALW
jgi:hypothetical protein